MEKRYSSHFIIRIASVLYVILFILVGLLPCWRGALRENLFYSLLGGNVVLAMYPKSYESVRPSLAFSLAYCTAGLLLALLAPRHWAYLACSLAFLLSYVTFRAVHKFSHIRSLFNAGAPMASLEDYSKFFYLNLLHLVVIMYLLFQGGLVSRWIPLALALPLAVVQYLRAWSGSTYFVSREKEQIVKDIIKGNLRIPARDTGVLDVKMKALWDSIVTYMEHKKPYLDEDLNEEKFAESLFTNKSYLSKTVNIFACTNFRRFINSYRIRHAVSLIDADPKIKVLELAARSGFSSTVSFTMAFKAEMGENPSDFTRRMQARLL